MKKPKLDIRPKVDLALCPAGKLVLIEWEDIVSQNGWADKQEAKRGKPATCLSVGWIIHRDNRKITIGSDTGDDEYGNRTTIPMGCIKAIQYL